MMMPSRQLLRDWSAALTLGPLDPADPDETRYVALADGQLTKIIRASGGHLRDLFTLLRQVVNLIAAQVADADAA